MRRRSSSSLVKTWTQKDVACLSPLRLSCPIIHQMMKREEKMATDEEQKNMLQCQLLLIPCLYFKNKTGMGMRVMTITTTIPAVPTS